MKKLRADSSQGMHAIIRCKIFSLLGSIQTYEE